MTQRILTWNETSQYAQDAVRRCIKKLQPWQPSWLPAGAPLCIFGVPRGGLHIAALLHGLTIESQRLIAVDKEEDAHIIVDDVIDSGATRDEYLTCTGKPFVAALDKQAMKTDTWIVFPWERYEEPSGPEHNIRRLLQFIGEDPTREGLQDTPMRVIKSYSELFAGYKTDVASLFTIFEDDTCDEMVILKDIEFYSMCEHHMQLFYGRGHIGYIPDSRVVGISKLARVLDAYSRRLQIQERISKQVTTALDHHLSPLGSACVLEASHSCIRCRGVGKQHSRMVTSSMTGAFRKAAVRNEFLHLIK